MKRTIYFSLFMCLVSFISQAQNEHYYYYQGEKISLELDPQRILVMSHNESDLTKIDRKSIKSSTDIQIDKTHATLKKIPGLKNNFQDFYWKKIELTSLSKANYEHEISALKKENPDLIIAPHFKMYETEKLASSSYFYVKLKSVGDINLLNSFAKKKGVELIGQNKYMPLWFTLSVAPDTPNAVKMANTFHESGLFSSAEPDLMLENAMLSSPNDPLYFEQWGLKNTGTYRNRNGQYIPGKKGIDIKIEQAWTMINETDLETLKVAVIDGGIQSIHEDLNVTTGYDAENLGGNAQLYINGSVGLEALRGAHGTSVAGTIGAIKNNVGVVGVAPNVKLVPVSVDFFSGMNRTQKLTAGIIWAAQVTNADVINISWKNNYSNQMDDAINAATLTGRDDNNVQRGCLIVAASNNIFSPSSDISTQTIAYPASNPNVLAVGSISPCGERSSYSSCDGSPWASGRGSELSVVAPGVYIATTDLMGVRSGYDDGLDNKNYTLSSGTSAAAPFASGLAALMIAADPDLKATEIKSIIELTSQKVGNYSYGTVKENGAWNNDMGYGLINAKDAVDFAKNTANPKFLDTDIVCGAASTIVLTNLDQAVTWQTSSNLTILGSNDSSITVKASNPRITGSGWVRATFNGQVLQKDIWLGRPSISIPPLPFFCPDQYHEIDFPITQGATEYKVSWSSPNIEFTDVFNNQWFNYPLNYLRFYGTEGDYVITFQVKNPCGEIRTNHFEVRINAANANCGSGGGGGPTRTTETKGGKDSPDNVILHPNPSKDVVNIKIPDQLEVRNIFILNMNGQRLRRAKSASQVDIRNLHPGIYLLQIETSTNTIVKRFIKN